mgnify:CR=1 FL=1
MFATRLIRKNFRRDLMSEKKTVYSRRAHSVCRLTYHAVFVVNIEGKEALVKQIQEEGHQSRDHGLF